MNNRIIPVFAVLAAAALLQACTVTAVAGRGPNGGGTGSFDNDSSADSAIVDNSATFGQIFSSGGISLASNDPSALGAQRVIPINPSYPLLGTTQPVVDNVVTPLAGAITGAPNDAIPGVVTAVNGAAPAVTTIANNTAGTVGSALSSTPQAVTTALAGVLPPAPAISIGAPAVNGPSRGLGAGVPALISGLTMNAGNNNANSGGNGNASPVTTPVTTLVNLKNSLLGKR